MNPENISYEKVIIRGILVRPDGKLIPASYDGYYTENRISCRHVNHMHVYELSGHQTGNGMVVFDVVHSSGESFLGSVLLRKSLLMHKGFWFVIDSICFEGGCYSLGELGYIA